MVWDSPGPGPFGQVTLGQKKKVCTSLSKILTVSKNPQTNMFLLIVGQLRYPEVAKPCAIVVPILIPDKKWMVKFGPQNFVRPSE